MNYTPRYYQTQAADNAVNYLTNKKNKYNAIEVLPTGSGKSFVIAEVAKRLNEPVIVFQPTKEILEQNFEKFQMYDPWSSGVFSASVNKKEIRKVTYATIGSVVKSDKTDKSYLFSNFKYGIIDECHLVNPDTSMYKKFMEYHENMKFLGLTATPYRMYSNSWGTELRMLTRTRPRVFKDIIYHVGNPELLDQGYIVKNDYVKIDGFDSKQIELNNNQSEFKDESLRKYLDKIKFNNILEKIIGRVIVNRKNFIVFTRFVEEAKYLSRVFPDNIRYLTAKTPKKERSKIISDFRNGKIQGVANVDILGIGFDFPQLETIVLAAPTMSMGRYYQWIGRAIRPYPDKKPMVIDLCDNIRKFGKVENFRVEKDYKGRHIVTNGSKQLTNVYFEN